MAGAGASTAAAAVAAAVLLGPGFSASNGQDSVSSGSEGDGDVVSVDSDLGFSLDDDDGEDMLGVEDAVEAAGVAVPPKTERERARATPPLSPPGPRRAAEAPPVAAARAQGLENPGKT